MLDAIYMIIQWILILLIRIPLMIIGLGAVAIGLLSKVHHPATRKLYTKYYKDEYWEWITLPKWLWIWSNDRDGMVGDKRGWYLNYAREKGWSEFVSMWHWGAVRNPVNNMRFVRGISCNASICDITPLAGVSTYDIDDKVGKTGFQWIKAKGPTFNYYQLYWVRPNKDDPEKAFILRLGHKFKISHNDTDWSKEEDTKVWKGFTFRIGFNKDIS